jgi:ABC-2 type transport system ATP-binding protein
VLQVLDVHKAFGGVHAVRGVSFSLDKGVVAGLLGPNGAGKSTTIRMIAGLIPPDAGSISVGGHDTLDGSMAARSLIGYMPESSPLYEEMTAEGLLRFRAELRGIGRRERGAVVGKAIERCRLEDVRRRRIVALSKGYRQRVALASAILGEPSLVILDEPTSGLDPSQVLETRRLVRELGERSAVLITSHVLGEIEAMCAKVIIIARGQVLAQGSLAELSREASAGNGALRHVVEVQADAARCACFAGAPGVVSSRVVELGDGWTRVEIEPSGETPDLRERLGEVARAEGLPLRVLRREEPTLESLFMRVTGDGPSAKRDGARDGKVGA